ncbi:MAG: dNTP triphosphohydrolase [Dehalococcoidia bacterium]
MPKSDRYFDELDDQRGRGERDVDRVQYSSGLARLAGVTQVLPADAGHPFHNRLVHSLKVGQIARRIAENLRESQQDLASAAQLDTGMCAAAGLAHDLGHPPFGHIGEATLDDLVRDAVLDERGAEIVRGDPDGFEGNAQSFRIVTALAQRRDEFDGLNLTRGSLNGILKYPVGRSTQGRHPKFGHYASEATYFEWVRQEGAGSGTRSIEADVMDWSDDVAYAVHDIEDFYRAGLVPIDRLFWSQEERRALLEWVKERWKDKPTPSIPLDDWTVASRTLDRILTDLPMNRWVEPYVGTRSQRKTIRRATAFLIRRYLLEVRIRDGGNGVYLLDIPRELRQEVDLLKEFIWYYVIARPALRTQQAGQERIVRDLFGIFVDGVERQDISLLPVTMHEAIDLGISPRRATADLLASLTENQCVSLWRRMTGVALGSIFDYPTL